MAISEDERIRGKVAGILNQRELVLNLGEADEIELGMRFAILNSKGLNIPDPDHPGKVLGTIEVPKTIVKVVRVSGPHLCVARTFRTIAGTPGIFGTISNLNGTPSRPETLDIASGSTLKAELNEQDSYIKVGDIAVETAGDEYYDM